MRDLSILKLVPKELEAQIVARPELDTFERRLSWIKAQLAHQRATSQAQAVAEGRSGLSFGELGGCSCTPETSLARSQAKTGWAHTAAGRLQGQDAPLRCLHLQPP